MGESRYDLSGVDKLDEIYTLRISEFLKRKVDRLPAGAKDSLNWEIRIIIAKAIHDQEFDPRLYLKSD